MVTNAESNGLRMRVRKGDPFHHIVTVLLPLQYVACLYYPEKKHIITVNGVTRQKYVFMVRNKNLLNVFIILLPL